MVKCVVCFQEIKMQKSLMSIESVKERREMESALAARTGKYFERLQINIFFFFKHETNSFTIQLST